MTSHVGIIGYPLGHSISPAFQQAAFDLLGLDVTYERWETPPEKLARRFELLREPDCLGANVTVPYKQDALKLVDEIDPLAERIGAINTVVNRDGRLHGYNTDAEGFLRSLREETGFDPTEKRVLVVGAGGAARAVAFALADAGATRIVIANRTVSRAQGLADVVSSTTGIKVEASPLPPDQNDASFNLIVQCTSVGMRGGPEESEAPDVTALVTPGTLVADLVYNPLETPLLREARERGAKVSGGLGMLVYQGAAAFSLWTGQAAPVDTMYAAAKQALGVTV